jgi:hypothetical protein
MEFNWWIERHVLIPPDGDTDEKLRTDPEVQKARIRLKIHVYNLPHYRR